MSEDIEVIGGDALAQLEAASINQQVATARKYPRDFGIVKKKMLSLATLDAETAATCFYKLVRSGNAIEGPSVRMSEIATTCFGNIRAASRVIANDGRVITAQGVCHDLENNTLISVEVKRRITDKNNKTYSEDMQVVTGNAACAIAFRNAVFKVVPLALIKPVYEEAKRCAIGDIKTLLERRTTAMKYFAALGVSKEQVLQHLGKQSVESVDLVDLETLLGLSTAIKEGSTSVDETFGTVTPVGKTATVKPPPASSFTTPSTPSPSSESGESEGQVEPAGSVSSGGSDDQSAGSEVPPSERATPVQGLRNLASGSGVSESQLLAYFKGVGIEAATLDEVPENLITGLIAQWGEQLRVVQGAQSPADVLAENRRKLDELMVRDNITEKGLMKWLKDKKWTAAPTLQGVAPHRIGYLVENWEKLEGLRNA